jgi:hypothetical protein
MERVFVYDGRIHADTERDGDVIELYPVETATVTTRWTLESFDPEPNEPGERVLWRRSD